MLESIISPSTPHQSIDFEKIDTKDLAKTIGDCLEMAQERIKKIENEAEPNFTNIIEALELSSIELDRTTSLFFNLYHACTDKNIDNSVGEVSEKLAAHSNNILLSEKLFAQIKTVHDSSGATKNLNAEQKKLLHETYEDFRRNGALLILNDKEKLRNIDQEMASLSPQYSQNLLKATHAFSLNIEDKNKVTGLPDSVLSAAQEEAKKREQSGWTFTLQAPSYVPFLKYMSDRELRKKMWMAYNSKALDGEFSNRKICQRIAELRLSRANLLGFDSHADFVLQKRMAKNPQQVKSFLEELKEPSLKAAKKELAALKAFVNTELKQDIEIQPWDFSHFSEKYKKHLYDLSDEELRPYFPLESVIEGLFKHGQKLYGLEFKVDPSIPTYHPEVLAYQVSSNSQFVGLLYVDLFPRENKKAGAWMTNYLSQGFDGKSVKRPHVSIVCNFSRPSGDKPSLLTFNEVQTLFHEFGHSLHSLLSKCHYQSLAGTNVLWDFVELPSQIMENWTYEKQSLDMFAKHYQTGAIIPGDLVDKLRNSMNFHAGYASTRQITFSLIDLRWHSELANKDLDPVAMEKAATDGLQLLPRIENSNFSVSFSHIFAGGYSAGYYSYKWAEVLEADAFEAFKEGGLFNQEIAHKFRDEVLAKGGVEDPAILYRNFRGKDPDSKALLARSGLS